MKKSIILTASSSLLFSCSLLLAQSSQAPTDGLRTPLTADFAVQLNGKPVGEANMTVSPAAENDATIAAQYDLEFSIKATKGLGGFAGVTSTEMATLQTTPSLRSLYYSRRKEHLFSDDQWSAELDWQTQQINYQHDDDQWKGELTADTTDPISLYFHLAEAASQGLRQFELALVDDDGEERYQFDLRQGETLESVCGPVETVVYQGVLPGSYKKIWTWHAEDYDMLPFRVRKTRKDNGWAQLDLNHLQFGDLFCEAN